MKRNILDWICTCLIILLVAACEDELPTRANYTAYAFSDLDVDGGSWSPILLSSVSAISIDVPADVTSNEYQNELTSLKSETESLNGDEKRAVDYWTNNSV